MIVVIVDLERNWREEETPDRHGILPDHVAQQANALAVELAELLAELQAAVARRMDEELVELEFGDAVRQRRELHRLGCFL